MPNPTHLCFYGTPLHRDPSKETEEQYAERQGRLALIERLWQRLLDKSVPAKSRMQ